MSARTDDDAIRLTRIKKAGRALLSKKITLGQNGHPVSDGSACAMSNGEATRVEIARRSSAGALAGLISDLGPHEALVLGDHVAEAPTIEITLAAHADPGAGRHGRTLETFSFRAGEPAVTLLDHDQKAMSDAARARLEEHGGIEGALAHLIPGYAGLSRVVRASTSAGIRNAETGERFPGSGGLHVYLFAKDGADVPRFLHDLHKRAWLDGLGWIMVAKRGALLIRSVVDITVGSPERLVFEGKPLVVAPLEQDHDDGDLIDTLATCPPLTPEEEQRCAALIEAAKREKMPEVDAAKETAAKEIAALRNIGIEKARAVVEASTRGELWSWDVLHFDDDEIGEVAVADVLADPARYHGETLADPLEGRGYGRGKARLYWNADNAVVINSFAHGGCVYAVQHDADYIAAQIETAGAGAPHVLASLMTHARGVDAVARERLRNRAAEAGGVTKPTVTRQIKDAVQAAERAAADAARARGDGRRERRDGRELMVVRGGERPGQLRTIEAKLRLVAGVGVGSVIYRGQAAVVIRLAVDPVKLRAGEHDVELPAGSAYLSGARPEHLQAQLDRLFAFARPGSNNDLQPVDCPVDLARYALANANLLPLQCISRTPVLRADGSVLNEPGYDTATAVYYEPDIDFPPIPDAPTQEDAAAALERLRHPLRGFPFCTSVDRDAAVGSILTQSARHLMPRAPGFVHSAPEAGSGKTKLCDTVSIIMTGNPAPLLNPDILDDETELKKVLTTLTVAATPMAVFDNAARGKLIDSVGLSNYLTAAICADRLLGTMIPVNAATCTVIFITGNMLSIATDQARRFFLIEMDAGVERPELRPFAFDCEVEVRRDRGALVAAALTILRAHALAGWPVVPGRAALGSFEDWDRLVAGAIAFAGGDDIVALLDKNRDADPERDDLAEVLRMLTGVGATHPMKTGEIIEAVAKARAAIINATLYAGRQNRKPAAIPSAVEWHDLLCRFSKDGKPNAKSFGRYLAKNAGRIVDGMQLVAAEDTHGKTKIYRARQVAEAEKSQNGDNEGKFCGVAGFSEVSPNRPNVGERVSLSRTETNTPPYIKGLADFPQNPAYPANPQTAQAASNGGGIPSVLSKKMQTALRKRGYTDAEISALTSQQASSLLLGHRAGVPFMITQKMKAKLRELGVHEGVVAELRPEDAHRMLDAPETVGANARRPPEQDRSELAAIVARYDSGDLAGNASRFAYRVEITPASIDSIKAGNMVSFAIRDALWIALA